MTEMGTAVMLAVMVVQNGYGDVGISIKLLPSQYIGFHISLFININTIFSS